MTRYLLKITRGQEQLESKIYSKLLLYLVALLKEDGNPGLMLKDLASWSTIRIPNGKKPSIINAKEEVLVGLKADVLHFPQFSQRVNLTLPTTSRLFDHDAIPASTCFRLHGHRRFRGVSNFFYNV